MKPIKKEDMPKLIVLIVLAVGIFAFAVVQMISLAPPSVAATTPAVPGTTVVASATGATPLQDPSALDAPAHPELDFLRIGPPTGGKDPFAPNGAASPANIEAAKVVAPIAPPIISAPLPQAAQPVQPLNVGVGFPGGIGDGPTVTEKNPVPAPVELPAPSWGVSGIVLAESDSDGIKRGRDVAILRDTAGDRRFVTVGDPVGNDYHVSAVRPAGVEIRNKKRTAMIRLDSLSNPSERSGASTGSRN